jgi:hypothetical protein
MARRRRRSNLGLSPTQHAASAESTLKIAGKAVLDAGKKVRAGDCRFGYTSLLYAQVALAEAGCQIASGNVTGPLDKQHRRLYKALVTVTRGFGRKCLVKR